MKRRSPGEARFELGHLYVDPQIAHLLSFADVQALVRRHERGDWGRVDADRRKKNEKFLLLHGPQRSYRDATSVHEMKNVQAAVTTAIENRTRTTLVHLLSHRTGR